MRLVVSVNHSPEGIIEGNDCEAAMLTNLSGRPYNLEIKVILIMVGYTFCSMFYLTSFITNLYRMISFNKHG